MINQYTLEGQYLRSFSKIIDAAKSFGDKWESAYDCIQKACMENSNKKTAYGYQWTNYYTEKIEPYKGKNQGKPKTIIQYDLQGNQIAYYESLAEASRKTLCNSSLLRRVCNNPDKRTAGGYKWRWADE